MAEFGIKKTKKTGKGESRIICISGEMTIMHAGQMRDALLELLTSEDGICIDVKAVTEIDLTGLQLLCSAHRAAIAAQKKLEVVWGENKLFEAKAEEAGFLRHVGCIQDHQKTCIWVGGK